MFYSLFYIIIFFNWGECALERLLVTVWLQHTYIIPFFQLFTITNLSIIVPILTKWEYRNLLLQKIVKVITVNLNCMQRSREAWGNLKICHSILTFSRIFVKSDFSTKPGRFHSGLFISFVSLTPYRWARNNHATTTKEHIFKISTFKETMFYLIKIVDND